MGDETEQVTHALKDVAWAIWELLGPKPPRDQLEQWMCFTAAAWNAALLVQACDDRTLMRDLISRIEALPGPMRELHSDVFLEVCRLKVALHPSAGWVYRGVHVVVVGGQLRVRAEAISLLDWLQSGKPLRMGLAQ